MFMIAVEARRKAESTLAKEDSRVVETVKTVRGAI